VDIFKKIIVFFIVILLLPIISVSCTSAEKPQSEESTNIENLESYFVGKYILRTPASGSLFQFDLREDNSIIIEELYVDEGLVASGTWSLGEETVEIDIDEIDGKTPEEETALTIKLEDGFPYEIDIIQGQQIENLEITEFSLGSGDSHKLLEELNRRLEYIDYLEYRSTEEDMVKYTENVRKAVAKFQQSQGIVSNGVVDIETWRLLKDPKPSIEYEEPIERPEDEDYGDPDVDPAEKTGSGGKILYFTFDDGPHPKYSQQVIDEFAKYDGTATFFVLGDQVNNFPDMVREETKEGHYIANHTNSHTSLDGISKEQFIEEMEITKKAIIDTAGDLFGLDKDVRYMRPPYGATDENTRNYAAELGYYVVLWDIDTQDWRRPGPDQIAEYIMENAYPGAIILMHDGGGDREQTVEALRIALPELDKQGYVFKSIFFKDFES
jgi:peptidoglycan/xylan/chitin deacetylase (PgdA/CDA1 family)